MLVNFIEHINHHFSFLKNKKILVAISGGIDSVVLTHLLHHLEFNIVLAHCNFSLRGKESDADAQFVKDLANKLDIDCKTSVFDTQTYAKKQQLSTQMAARELRYKWFEKTRIEFDLDYIVTAHHLDDNLETFLINFIRGTGLNGLTGIPEIKGKIIRPLIPFSRKEIEVYASENNLSWREDASNKKTAYQRNKIRHQIVPLLKQMNPSLLNSFQKTTNNLKESQSIINNTIESFKKIVISTEHIGNINSTTRFQKIDIQKLKQFEYPKAYLFELLKEYRFTEWNDVVDLLNAQPGKQVLSASHRLVKDRDFLLLTEINSVKSDQKVYEIKESQEVLELENGKFLFKKAKIQNSHVGTQNSVFINQEKLIFPLTLRKMKQGDYFYPLGMEGKKKISKFFKDEKLSLIDKENTWLLCSNNDIVWIVNKRLDDRYKVDHSTDLILNITFIKE